VVQSVSEQSLPTIKVSARELAPDDNFAGWRQTLGGLFDIDLNGLGGVGSFRADLASYFMGPIVLGTGDSTAQHYERNSRTIARSGIDPFLIQLYTRGGFAGTSDGKEMTVQAGDVCVFDMARELKTFSPRSANVTLVVPPALLAPLVKDADALHGTVLSGSSPLGGVLADHMRAVHARVERLSLAEAVSLADGTVSLIAACVGPHAERKENAGTALDSALLFQIRRYIESNIGSAKLTADVLCGRFALSRASLYRLFEPFDGVAKYIRKRRLYHSLLRITSSANAHKLISEIAYGLGFTNESDFSRAFRAAHGLTPREARETPARAWRHSGDQGTSDPDGSVLSQWIREISL
jgi:AraC-like DNA-binding protein